MLFKLYAALQWWFLEIAHIVSPMLSVKGCGWSVIFKTNNKMVYVFIKY